MRKVVGWVGVGLCVITVLAAMAAYFITSRDANTGILYDGLGRKLSESPLIIRVVFGADRLWPGVSWFCADFVWFWTGMIMGYNIASWGLAGPIDR